MSSDRMYPVYVVTYFDLLQHKRKVLTFDSLIEAHVMRNYMVEDPYVAKPQVMREWRFE